MRSKSPKSVTRILALDIHPRSFGYVIMEGPDRLLDWGVKRSDLPTPKKHPAVLARRRFRPLLVFWKPDVVVGRFGEQKKKAMQAILKRFRREVRRVSFLPVKHDAYHAGNATKHERASEIAKRFPEIGWKLPPKRKDWESEHYSMSIFEAAEAALTYLNPTFGAPSNAPVYASHSEPPTIQGISFD